MLKKALFLSLMLHLFIALLSANLISFRFFKSIKLVDIKRPVNMLQPLNTGNALNTSIVYDNFSTDGLQQQVGQHYSSYNATISKAVLKALNAANIELNTDKIDIILKVDKYGNLIALQVIPFDNKVYNTLQGIKFPANPKASQSLNYKVSIF